MQWELNYIQEGWVNNEYTEDKGAKISTVKQVLTNTEKRKVRMNVLYMAWSMRYQWFSWFLIYIYKYENGYK